MYITDKNMLEVSMENEITSFWGNSRHCGGDRYVEICRILTIVVYVMGLDGEERAFQILFILETQVHRRKVQGTFRMKKIPVWPQ